MRFNVNAETLWLVLATEAWCLQASSQQLEAIQRLEALAALLVGDDADRIAELNVEMYDQVLRICISECDRLGMMVTNGAWCRLSINPAGRVSMTDSVDQERISVLEPA